MKNIFRLLLIGTIFIAYDLFANNIIIANNIKPNAKLTDRSEKDNLITLSYSVVLPINANKSINDSKADKNALKLELRKKAINLVSDALPNDIKELIDSNNKLKDTNNVIISKTSVNTLDDKSYSNSETINIEIIPTRINIKQELLTPDYAGTLYKYKAKFDLVVDNSIKNISKQITDNINTNNIHNSKKEFKPNNFSISNADKLNYEIQNTYEADFGKAKKTNTKHLIQELINTAYVDVKFINKTLTNAEFTVHIKFNEALVKDYIRATNNYSNEKQDDDKFKIKFANMNYDGINNIRVEGEYILNKNKNGFKDNIYRSNSLMIQSGSINVRDNTILEYLPAKLKNFYINTGIHKADEIPMIPLIFNDTIAYEFQGRLHLNLSKDFISVDADSSFLNEALTNIKIEIK